MQFSNVAIEGWAHVDAPVRVTSAEIEAGFTDTLARLGQKPGLLETLTGVVARRFFEPGTQPSDAATMAAEAALAHAGLAGGEGRERIGVIVNTSVCKDFIEPSVASTVHGNLGLSASCLNFDIGNACLAFLGGMSIVANLIERGAIDYGLIVDGENSRFAVERTVERLAEPGCDGQTLRDNFATLTLGSGAAAMVLCRADLAARPHRFVGGISRADTASNHLCRGQADEMVTDAGGLLKAGVALAEQTFADARRTLGWSADDLDLLVMHQVGSVHARTLLSALGLDQSRAHFTFPEFGNIGPAAIPITLSKAVEAGRAYEGDRVALMGIGSGLNCAMMEIQW